MKGALVDILNYAPADVAIEIIKKLPPGDFQSLCHIKNQNIVSLCSRIKVQYANLWSKEIVLKLEDAVWENNFEDFKFWYDFYDNDWNPTESLRHPEYTPGQLLMAASRPKNKDIRIFKILVNNPNVTLKILNNIFNVSIRNLRFNICDIILEKLTQEEKYEMFNKYITGPYPTQEKILAYILDNIEFKDLNFHFKNELLKHIMPYQRFNGYVKLFLKNSKGEIPNDILNESINLDILKFLLENDKISYEMKVDLFFKFLDECNEIGGEQDRLKVLIKFIDITKLKSEIIQWLLEHKVLDKYSLVELKNDNVNPIFTSMFEEDHERDCVSILFGDNEESKIDFRNFDWSEFADYMKEDSSEEEE